MRPQEKERVLWMGGSEDTSWETWALKQAAETSRSQDCLVQVHEGGSV